MGYLLPGMCYVLCGMGYVFRFVAFLVTNDEAVCEFYATVMMNTSRVGFRLVTGALTV